MRETDWAPVSFVSILAVEHPIVRVDTNDRVQHKPHVTSDVGPEVLAEMVYRGMATGQRWGRGRRQAQGPVGSPIGQAQSPAGRPIVGSFSSSSRTSEEESFACPPLPVTSS